MRLEKIKLAGFKSFVDPTTVHFPSNLVGIVGPNGCGKSNVIDAVRWVMGESSAKMLRGESMSDVIFNGSSSRKPVGTASIELIFDNSDGSAGGQYAQYAQISVKRQVSRDGQSLYFLNGVRCRRRDITDLFLGTGLGPRSYSIIEQGMISRIIEARPEELRVYLEEAAGISKYKERRRETENRIRHTRENLERLDDVREEVQKHLRHLERQAATAEKYKALKEEERRVRAELLALRLARMQADVEQRDRQIAEQETALEAAIARQREVEAEIEAQRAAHVEANDQFNGIQGRFYEVGSEIARLEEAIQYAREARRQQEVDLEQAERALEEARELSQQDRSRLQQLAEELERDRPRLEAARDAEEATRARLAQAEEAMAAWQAEWDRFNEQVNEPAQQAQVERTRINHLEQQEQQLRRRIERNQEEQRRLSDIELEAEIAELLRREQESEAALALTREQTARSREQIEQARADIQQRQEALNELRSELQALKGRLSSLQALQQAAKGEDDEALNQWLEAHGLAAARRLLEGIEVEGRWQQAVEVALGHHLQAVLVEDLDAYAADADGLGSVGVRLFESREAGVSPRPGTLASQVRGPAALTSLLNGIRLAENLSEAMARRGELAEGESWITPEGILVGGGWLAVARRNDAESGILAREGEIRELTAREQALQPRIEEMEAALEQARERLREAEQQREQAQSRQDAGARTLAELKALLSGKQARAEQIRQRLAGLEEEARELQAQLQQGAEETAAARERLHAALARVDELDRRREALLAERERHRQVLDEARQAAATAHAKVHELALRIESIRSTEDSLKSGIDRVHSQVERLEERVAELRQALEESKAPIGEQQITLETRLQERVAVEAQLAEARKALEAIDHRLRELEQSRHGVEQKVQEARTRLDQSRMARQEVVVRAGTLREQLGETGLDLETLLAEMPEEADIEPWQQRAEQLANRIQRLGPINLAAIDEFREQSERMEYLNRQHDDVSKSLETLEEAIRKIDRETRTRFKETFDKVDAGFKELFPKLFGGGHAYLELTGEDLLDTGVSVMARPPGKRNSSIHLLSGGEKALTAVALVFAIFRLNPAPFCMLDEVDAPLDDANVGRYSQLVKEMSEHVQFIFITHNKVTMEIANQLMGVTMHEPGVSRLVSVDVEEAASLAAV
ncbi:MAG: chromosome segregation protein SMC [Gammaproteobacteria bacterium]|nr:MAG: chromosome segregation protein SMC [Gammaproteobacteria bacterium]